MTADFLTLRSAKPEDVTINKAEALRYLGLYTSAAPESVEQLYSGCLEEIRAAADFRAVYSKTPVTLLGDGKIDLGFAAVQSEKLEKNLQGCREAYIFAATAGFGVDRLVQRYKRLSLARSLVCDAIGSAAAEGFCNLINGEMKKESDLSPRFSPGYGGLSLSCQGALLGFLDAQRKIGVTLSDTMFMSPSKTVTAIVGIRGQKEKQE